ncbi:MAG TPA: hypothetical protein VFE51_12760 [Verrucomicrobiae bacterium]|nr:hypothetical protein [Verrucomicrobiae bacterium]
MNSEQKPSSGQPSSFWRSGRPLFTWPRVRRGLLALLWLATLIALFYAEEDWRGRHAWRNYSQQLQVRGTPVGLAPLIPKPVPDDQNFAMTPLLAPLFDFVPGTQQWRDKSAVTAVQDPLPDYKDASGKVKEHQEGDWARGQSIDLAGWANAYEPTMSKPTAFTNRADAARALLVDLQEWTLLLKEIQRASERPYARFNIRYEEENTPSILLPHLAVLKRYVQVLKLRASAELANGQSAPALEDIELAIKVANSIKDEPILISTLVRMSELQLVLQPVWEGMAAGSWTPEQLKDLQLKLSEFDILTDARRAFDDDRGALGNPCIEFVRRAPSQHADAIGLFDSANTGTEYAPFAEVFLRLIPSGWFYQEQVEYNRIYDQLVMPLIDTKNRLVSPELASHNQHELQQLLEGDPLTLTLHHRLFARLLVPAVSNLAPKVARTQTAVDLAVTACSLERFRLEKGHYPDELNLLVPAYLAKVPNDVIDGKPLRYRKEGQRFALYSVGWNAQDNGGQFPGKPEGGREFKRGIESAPAEAGDWVWRYPAS